MGWVRYPKRLRLHALMVFFEFETKRLGPSLELQPLYRYTIPLSALKSPQGGLRVGHSFESGPGPLSNEWRKAYPQTTLHMRKPQRDNYFSPTRYGVQIRGDM